MPSGGVYLPKDKAAGFDPMKDDAVVAVSDGEPMFRPAKGRPDDAAVYDLMGNVAEFVLADAEAEARVEALPLACKVDDAFALFAAGKEFSYRSLRVIGGSAISPPPPAGYDPAVPQEIWATSPTGYSDVGFRLAISKGDGTTGKNPRERALHAMERKFRFLSAN